LALQGQFLGIAGPPIDAIGIESPTAIAFFVVEVQPVAVAIEPKAAG